MPARFYDPNNTEEQRLRRAAWGDEGANRSFTDRAGRSGFETRDGDLRMRRYDGGGTFMEQRGPGGEWRAWRAGSVSPDQLQNPDRTGQIAPDRTGADRLARAIADNPGWDRLATPEQRGLAGVGAIGGAGMLQRARESGFVVNPNDLLHERSFGTNAVLASRARGFGGAPTAVEMFGTDAQKEAAQGIYDRAREQYLMDQAGLNGLARSAAGGSEGRAAALRELEALRMQRAQENARQSADLARREGFANEQAVAGISAQGKIDAAAAAAQGQVDAAREQGQARRDAANRRAEAIENSAKIQAEAAGKRPIPLGGGLGAVRNDDGSYTVVGQTGTGASEQKGVTLKPGESYYNPQSGALFVAPGADRTSIEAEIRGLTDALAKALTAEQQKAIEDQLTDARERLAKLPAGPQAGGAGDDLNNY